MAPQGSVLFLGDPACSLVEWLRETQQVVCSTAPIDPEFIAAHHIDFLISYGYRHIIAPNVLARLPARAINLHISLLPWNRGADPNLWSFIDNTPKGVTIHYIDAGIDTGDIIVQREVRFDNESTLATSYQQLTEEIEQLFRDNWSVIRSGECSRCPQMGRGSYHARADRAAVASLLENGWDTAITRLSGSP